MKKKLLILLMLGCGIITSLDAQVWNSAIPVIGGGTDSPIISFTAGQAYVSADNQFTGFGNNLWMPADSLNTYKLGEINDKVVQYGTDCRFRFYWEDHPEAHYLYQVWNRLDTTLALESEKQSAVFSYTPLDSDVSSFEIDFSAINGTDTLTQRVVFNPVPVIHSEQNLITYMKDMEFSDTLLIRKTHLPGGSMNFNGEDSVLKINMIGKSIIFMDGNIPFTYQNLSNLQELNIFATKLIIRDTIHLPQTAVNIYCEELIFEDSENIIASINTTPRTPVVPNYNGLDAAEFHCYFKKLSAPGHHIRFYINGGQGSPSLMIPNTDNFSAPGGGGAGGDVYSNNNLEQLVNLEGGAYGTPTDWKNMPLGPRGKQGEFKFETNWYTWLHPHAVRFMLQYARECYIYGQEALVEELSTKYIKLINSYKDSENWGKDAVTRRDLDQLYYSFSAMREQLYANLDYFGNPKGWAPLLSFESNLQNYQNEIEFAIRVLYLDYWMNKKAETLEQKQDAASMVKGKAIGEITRLKEDYAEAYEEFVPALYEFNEICVKQDCLTILYNQQIQFLIEEAEDNVANSFEGIMRSIGNTLAQVAKCIPIPAAQAIGTGLEIAANFDYEDPLSTDNWNAVSDAFSEEADLFSAVSNIASGFAADIEPSSLIDPVDKQGAHLADQVMSNLSPENLQRLGNSLKKVSIPDDKVREEFEKLKRGYPLLDQWADSVETWTMKKGEIAEVMAFNTQKLTRIPTELTKMLLVCDAMDDILLHNENVLDPRAMTYLNEMKNTAWERMVRYHYYLAMAYQYRFLEPYPAALNLQPLFESFDTLAVHDSDLSPDQYSALLPVFENQIKNISDEIYTSFNQGTYTEFNEPITYTLSEKQLSKLNTSGELLINIWNSGKIPRQFVDCRITDISILQDKLKISQDTILEDATLMFLMAHSGNSALIHPTTGKHFVFSQYNDAASVYYNTSSMSPLGWAEKYFFFNGNLIKVMRSLASESLIRKILNVAGDEDLMIFTRPAAWADIKLITSLHTGEQTNMKVSIDSLTLLVNIDYKATTKFSNVLVNSSDGLLPLITVNHPDLNGKTYGWGNFTRSYNKTAGTITFTAPEEYGIYLFDKWKITTLAGTDEIYYNSVNVNPLYHAWISANYKLNVPELEVPDTLYVAWNQSSIDINVKNKNVCDLPMNWFSKTDCEWFSIKAGTSKGVEDGKISLILTLNNDDERSGVLRVNAYDAVNPLQEVVIIQGENEVGVEKDIYGKGLKIYPNPAGDEIFVQFTDRMYQKDCSVSILSTDGRTVLSIEIPYISKEFHKISLESLPAGMYIIKIKSEGMGWNSIFVRTD